MLRKSLYFATIFAFILMVVPFSGAGAISYLNAYPERVYFWDGSTYTNYTNSAWSEAPGDVLLGRDAPPKDSDLYITLGWDGEDSAYFDELYINVTSPGSAGEVVWEYSSAYGSWLSLVVNDETDSFTKSGWNKVSWEEPSDPGVVGVSGKLGFWVRARTIDSYASLPYAGQIEVRAYNLRVKVEDGEGVPISGMSVDNFELSDCDDTAVYGVRELPGGIYELALQTRAADTYCMIGVNKTGYSSFTKFGFGEVSNYVKDATYNPFVLHEIAGVSAIESVITKNKSEVEPDGVDYVEVGVYVKDAAREPISGVEVILESSRSEDEITPTSAISDSEGGAIFHVSSDVIGQSILTATADGVVLDQTAEVDFGHFGPEPGSLIKLADDGDPDTHYDSAVYYYAEDDGRYKRYAFPNDKVFFSWYDDFSEVQIVTSDVMADVHLYGNVTYRPGSKMLKIQSDPKTYAVAQGGVLRWIQTEELAIALYGTDWNTKIDDVDVAFWPNYTFGEDIDEASDFDPIEVYNSTTTISQNLGL